MSETLSTALARATRPERSARDGRADACVHCGAPNASAARWRLLVDGSERVFCCAGCLAVAQTIRMAGLERFYVQRNVVAERPPEIGGAWQGALVMAAFGIGTLPNVFVAGVALARARHLFEGQWPRRVAAAVLTAFVIAGLYRAVLMPEALVRGAFCIVP